MVTKSQQSAVSTAGFGLSYPQTSFLLHWMVSIAFKPWVGEVWTKTMTCLICGIGILIEKNNRYY